MSGIKTTASSLYHSSLASGRESTPEERETIEMTIRSGRVILAAMTGEMFLYGTEMYDWMEENEKQLYNNWGRKSVKRVEGREKQWRQRMRVDQNGAFGNIETFFGRLFYVPELVEVRTQVEYSLRLSCGKHGIKSQTLAAKALFWRLMAMYIMISEEGFLTSVAKTIGGISRTPIDTCKKIIKPYFSVCTPTHPDYLADACLRLMSRDTMDEIFSEDETKRAWQAYLNVHDRNWKVEKMVEAMEINGDPDAEWFREQMNEEPDLAGLVDESLRDKYKVTRTKQISQ